MKLKTIIPIAALLLLVLATPVAGATVNQEAPVPTTSTTTENEPSGERIDSELVLVSKDYDGSGSVTLVFESDSSKAVTLSDAGAFVDGGEVAQRTLVLDPGRNTVEFGVSQTENGYAGVSIGTKERLYAVPLKTQTTLIEGPFARGDVYTAGAAGLLAGLGVTALIAYRTKNETGGEPRRLV